MSIRAAKVENSERLQLTLRVLSDGQWHTSLEIHLQTGSMAVHTDIAELRAEVNRYEIDRKYFGQINGRRVYQYRLRGRRKAA